MKIFFRLIFLIWLMSFSRLNLHCQTDYSINNAKIVEYNAWLDFKQLPLKVDSFSFKRGKYKYFISFKNIKLCDSSVVMWKSIKKQVLVSFKIPIHQLLFEKMEFITELPEDSIMLNIRCRNDNVLNINIYKQQGLLTCDEKIESIMGSGSFDLKLPLLNNDTYKATSLKKQSIIVLRNKISTELYKFYKDKGTPILYKAVIDTTASYYQEFMHKITHISHLISDEGYFEYHQWKISIGEKNENTIEVRYEFNAKYGSGILCPPRINNYKDMELRYHEQMNEFEEKVIKLIQNKITIHE